MAAPTMECLAYVPGRLDLLVRSPTASLECQPQVSEGTRVHPAMSNTTVKIFSVSHLPKGFISSRFKFNHTPSLESRIRAIPASRNLVVTLIVSSYFYRCPMNTDELVISRWPTPCQDLPRISPAHVSYNAPRARGAFLLERSGPVPPR